MKINGDFVILFFFLIYSFSYHLYKSYKLSYIWKAESSFTGFGTQFYQSKSQIQY